MPISRNIAAAAFEMHIADSQSGYSQSGCCLMLKIVARPTHANATGVAKKEKVTSFLEYLIANAINPMQDTIEAVDDKIMRRQKDGRPKSC
jgi:hypothetical protein